MKQKSILKSAGLAIFRSVDQKAGKITMFENFENTEKSQVASFNMTCLLFLEDIKRLWFRTPIIP